MIRYRGSENSLFELVLPQLFRGLAEGFLGFPVQALVQVSRLIALSRVLHPCRD